MENNITLYGASGHGKVIVDVLKSSTDQPLVIIDDNPKFDMILGIPVIKTTDTDLSAIRNTIISIGNNKVRKRLSVALKTNFINAIHRSAIISPFSTIGKGTVVMAGVKINPDSVIGEHCIINTGAVIEHDNNIGD